MENLFQLKCQIDTTDLLSSRTYPSYGFNQCVYCHKDVENDYYEFNGKWYMPYRCNCENACKELESKDNLLNVLISLDNKIDKIKILNNIKEYHIGEINRQYEDELP